MFRELVQILFWLFASMLLTAAFFAPWLLSDSGNTFLKDFLDNDLLSVLGVITALANASILSIFLHLNFLEDKVNFKATHTRRSLRLSAVSLIVVFLVAFAVVILKPIVPEGEKLNAIMNSIGILLVIFALSVLRDITLTVIKIPSQTTIKSMQAENQKRVSNLDGNL